MKKKQQEISKISETKNMRNARQQDTTWKQGTEQQENMRINT